MKNWNRIAVFAGLTLLVIVLTIFLPSLDFFEFLRPARHGGFPWVTFAIIWVIFWCCCGRGCCRRRRYRHDDDAEEAKL